MLTKITSDGSIVGFEASGKITEEEYQRALAELRDTIAHYGSVNVLSRLPDASLPGMELSAIDDRLRFAKDHLKDVKRLAVVGGSTAAEWVARASDKLTGVQVRHFKSADEHQAWAWLRQPAERGVLS